MLKRKFWVIAVVIFIFNSIVSYLVFSYLEARTPYKETEETVFEPDSPQQDPEITIILGGDVMLGRSVNKKAADRNDFGYPFSKISTLFEESDLVFVNLESPFADPCPILNGGFSFCADPMFIEALTFGSIDVVNLSNNHIRNFGESGIITTKNILETAGIGYTGLGEFYVREVGGYRFGFLGFDFTVNDISEKDIELVKKSNLLCDVLIIGLHWGDEYKDFHNAKQERIAKLLVENGADVVAGHHPHWVQDIEYIDGKPVFYSLGNLVFDQMWSEETKKGLLVKLNFEGAEFKNYEEYPIYIAEVGEPELIDY